jgi:hypothetical protein
MALLGFKQRFADLVKNGTKRQTIRNDRKYPIQPGETLYLYWGLRTKLATKLGQHPCLEVHKININAKGVKIGNEKRLTTLVALNRFAFLDGFKDWEEMQRWWKLTHGPKCFPFNGILIKW